MNSTDDLVSVKLAIARFFKPLMTPSAALADSKSLFLGLAFSATVILSGCASVGGYFNRDVIENKIDADKSFQTLAMPGGRRIAVFRRGKVCAEALPDTARTIEAKSDAEVALKIIEKGDVSGSVGDEFITNLTKTYERTETSDIIRQLGWQMCQAYMNEGITEDQYFQLLEKLTEQAVKGVMESEQE